MELIPDDDRVLRALRLAARDAAILHKAMGVPLVVWEDGRVVHIPPEEIVIPEPEP